jgi:hypothetical protein
MPMPHSIIHGNACFAYFNKSWDIPLPLAASRYPAGLLANELEELGVNSVAPPVHCPPSGFPAGTRGWFGLYLYWWLRFHAS